jgi:hypothetical protein
MTCDGIGGRSSSHAVVVAVCLVVSSISIGDNSTSVDVIVDRGFLRTVYECTVLVHWPQRRST